ncbi:hypothetical protein K492DRAFT_172403 [Lichtheimia hyalospora FSU 10163]|nr:hypothetical protein K492DRAFT_172403 [Lichtheimia hyalospora FSU 10163]
MLVMVNTIEDPYVQTMTPYTPRELEYCRYLIERIVKAPNQTWEIGHEAAVNLGPSLKSKLTLTKTEELLDRLEQDGWLRVCNNHRSYALSPRSTVELESYLCKTYGSNYIHHCIVCSEIVTRGKQCRSCSVYVHHHCFAHAAAAGHHACSQPCQYATFGSLE